MHIFTDQPDSLIFTTYKTPELFCCPFSKTYPSHPNIHAHTKRSWSSRPIFSLVVQIKYSWPHWSASFCWENTTGVTSDDKVHLWEVGIGVKSGNCCPILLQQSTYNVSQEGSRCHKKSIKSTSNYPGNWQWNWKSLWPLRQPILHLLHPKFRVVWQQHQQLWW